MQLNWPYAWQANALQLSYICGVNMLYEERIKGYLYRNNNLSWYILLVLSRKDGIKISGTVNCEKNCYWEGTKGGNLRIRDDFLMTQKIWRKKGRGVLKKECLDWFIWTD